MPREALYGKRKVIIHFLTEPYEYKEGYWGRKVKLECGHIAITCIGRSANHRRCRQLPVKAVCTECIANDY